MSQPIYPLYQPQVLQETCEGICRFDVRDQMLANRELELCGPIDAESAAILIRNLLYLQRADAVAPIKMFINSPGGEVQSGLALYDVMQTLSCPVATICLGMAASMAALVFVSGARREMLPHSRVMILANRKSPQRSSRASVSPSKQLRSACAVTAQSQTCRSPMPELSKCCSMCASSPMI